jgi:hypothetical protein
MHEKLRFRHGSAREPRGPKDVWIVGIRDRELICGTHVKLA